MFEELKEVLLMVAQAGEVTLQAALSLVIAFGIYKLLTLASILMLVKFTIEKLYNYFITKKVKPDELVKWTIRNSNMFVAEEKTLYKIRDVARLIYKPSGAASEDIFYEGELKIVLKAMNEYYKNLEEAKINENV
jgi:hypothetical protein